MASPLTDADRAPWLASIRAAIEEWGRNEPGHIIACSLLKGHYRDILAPNDPNVNFVPLHGGFDLIYQRLKERTSHFFNLALFRSQFDALERPEGTLVVDISKDWQEIVNLILATVQPKTNWTVSSFASPPLSAIFAECP